jgi:hypothetical protein
MSHASHPSFLTLVKYPHIISRPWVAPSHRAVPILASALQSAYGLISSIPTLLVVDADTLELLTSGGCPWVRKDASASAFPWRGLPAPPPDFGSSNALVPMMAVSPVLIYFYPSQRALIHSAHFRSPPLRSPPSVFSIGTNNAEHEKGKLLSEESAAAESFSRNN